jgi:hypothetical protein
MKTLKVGRLIRVATFFFIACLGVSCSEDAPTPKNRIVGKWHFESDLTPLTFSFDVKQNGGTLSIENQVIEHPLITEDNSCFVSLWDKFENGYGYGKISIDSHRGDYFYVDMIYNQFTDNGNLHIYEMVIQMPGENTVTILNNVALIRTEN